MLPVVERELLVASRNPKTFRSRWMTAVVISAVGLAAFWVVDRFGSAVVSGQQIFAILAHLAFAYCVFGGVALTSDCLSAEKRENTIGFLFLTDLKGHDVVLGKLLATSLRSFYGLLAAFPVLGASLIIGGVEAAELWRVLLNLVNTLFLSLSVGLFISTMSRNQRTATHLASLSMLFLSFGLSVLGIVIGRFLGSMTAGLIVASLSPLTQHIVSFDRAYQQARISGFNPFWWSVIGQSVLSLALIWAASRILPHVWKEKNLGSSMPPQTQAARTGVSGKAARRLAIRRKLLDRNPFCWLAGRGRALTFGAWFVVLLIAGWVRWAYSVSADPLAVTSIALLLLFLVMKLLLCVGVCQRLTEDRQSGVLELLLTTPVTVKGIVLGQWLAAWRKLRWPLGAMIAADAWLFWMFKTRDRSPLGEVMAWLFWVQTILWFTELLPVGAVGVWMSMRCKMAAHAASLTLALVVLAPLTFSAAVCGLLTFMFNRSPMVESREMLFPLLWLASSLTNGVFWTWFALRKVHDGFRTAATDQYVGRRARERWWQRRREKKRAAVKSARSGLVWWRRHPVGYSILAVLALLIGAFEARRLIAERRLTSMLNEIRQTNTPTTLAELDQWYPFVPESENAASAIAAAARRMIPAETFSNKIARMGDDPRSLLTGRDGNELRAVVARFLSQNAPVLEPLHSLNWQAPSRFPIDLRNGYQTLLPHMAEIIRLVRLLQLEILLAVEKRDGESAFPSLLAMLALHQSLENEPCLTSQTFRERILSYFIPAFEETIRLRRLSESQLRSLAAALSAIEHSSQSGITRGLIGDRSMGIDIFSQSPGRLISSAGAAPAGAQLLLGLYLEWREFSGLRSREFAEYLREMENLIEISRMPFPESVRRARALASGERPQGFSQMRFAPPVPAQALTAGIERAAENTGRARSLLAAVAIERYRLANSNRIADSLSDLVPEYLAAVPKDPFAGQPLQYRRSDSGYQILCVNSNAPVLAKSGGKRSLIPTALGVTIRP